LIPWLQDIYGITISQEFLSNVPQETAQLLELIADYQDM
jgi:hypothetical protein